MNTRWRIPLVGSLLVAGIVATGTLAAANRGPIADLGGVLPEGTIESVPPLAEEGVTLDRGVASESLESVRGQGLFPFQWPWFADGVPTPGDAIAGAPRLTQAIDDAPSLAGVKLLSAEMRIDPTEPTTVREFAWLKLSANELVRIGTQPITPETVIPQEGEATPFAGGSTDVRWKDGALLIKLVIGDRLVTVDLQAVDPHLELSLNVEDLLDIGAEVLAFYR